MTASQPAARGGFTGWHMLMLALGFFGVIIAVNVLLTVLSIRTWTGQVVEDSYVAGQQYEIDRVDHDAQRAAGWSSRFAYAAGLARLTVVDGGKNPVDLGAATLTVRRPIGDKDDRTLALTRTPSGNYEVRLDLAPGMWDVIVAAPNTAKGVYELIDRIRVEGGS
jgi:nitrogen fixation protein FixH